MAGFYFENMNIRVPSGFTAAIAEAAKREGLPRSDFARRAVLDRIARAGVTPPPAKPVKKQGVE